MSQGTLYDSVNGNIPNIEDTWCEALAGNLVIRQGNGPHIKFIPPACRREVIRMAFHTTNGVPFTNSGGNRNVPYLNWNGDKRNLNGNDLENDWNGDNRFLVLRKFLHG